MKLPILKYLSIAALSLFVISCNNNDDTMNEMTADFSGTFSTGFVNQFPLDDADYFIDIDCHQVIGSYDPNDKTGMTPSIGPDHNISAGTELEYMIRFQNTGNDTAFTVRIEDQLSEFFDASTIRPLSSSHNFEMSFSEGRLEFLFPNILLVDSYKNEMLSHGFITFKVKLRDDLLPGTKISNSASIFFDSNAPVVTNTYDYNIPLPISTNFTSENVFSIYPNPTSDKVNIKLDWAVEGGTVYLYDLKGKLLKQNEFVGTSFIFPIEEINIGLYLIKIKDHNGNSSIHKIVKE